MIDEYVGGYHDAQEQRTNSLSQKAKAQAAHIEAAKKKEENKQRQAARPKAGKKLSYKLQKELEDLPLRIEELENEIAQLQELINDPAFFQDVKNDTQGTLNRLAEAEAEFEQAFERWEELEAMQKEA